MLAKKFNERFFSTIDAEDKAYWLGFLMADGCVNMTQSPSVMINLHKKDTLHLDKWHKAINSKNKIHATNSFVSSRHYSRTMCDDLIVLGCTPKKSLSLKFPTIDKDLYKHWIRGYLDGDGNIYQNPKTDNIKVQIIGTEHVLSKIQDIFGTNVKLENAGRANRLCIHGNKQCLKILDWIYGDATICLDRKEVYYSNLRI